MSDENQKASKAAMAEYYIEQYRRRAESSLAAPSCYATFELANGETVTPCHKPKGHSGDHEGWCLGSRCVWPQGFDSEYALHAESHNDKLRHGGENQ